MDIESDFTFEQLLEQLSSDYYKTQEEAAWALALKYPADARLFDVWVSLSDHWYGGIQNLVLDALDAYKDKKVIKPIIPLLRSSSNTVRWRAVEVLTELGEEVVEPLLDILDDDDYGVQYRLGRAFALYKEKALIPLLQNLYSPDHNRRITASHCLGYMDDTRIIDPLLEVLTNRTENGEVRANAADALYQFRNEKITSILINILSDKTEDNDARAGAAYTLGGGAEPCALGLILEALNDESEDVRAMAFLTIRHFNLDNGLDLIVKGLGDSSDWVRQKTTQALEHFKDYRLFEPLCHFLTQEKVGFIYLRGVDLLLQLFDEPDYVEPLIRSLIESKTILWEKVGPRVFRSLKHKKLVEPVRNTLVPMLSAESDVVRERASKALEILE